MKKTIAVDGATATEATEQTANVSVKPTGKELYRDIPAHRRAEIFDAFNEKARAKMGAEEGFFTQQDVIEIILDITNDPNELVWISLIIGDYMKRTS